MNFLSIYLGKFLFFLHFGRAVMLGIILFVGMFFLFVTLNILSHSFLACKFYPEKSAHSLMGVPLYMMSCFSVAAFKFYFLSLTFDSLNILCLGGDFLGFILFWGLLSFFNLLFHFPSPDMGSFQQLLL